MKIFLLEDDIILQEIIEEVLIQNGFQVYVCEDGYEAQTYIYENRFDLLLLDVNVPNLNGFELLQKLRTNQNITVESLVTNILDYDNVPTDATVRTYIKNLRKYIGKRRFQILKE